LKDNASQRSVDLYFGPTAPAGKESQWIKTIPGKGWFTDFRIHGPMVPSPSPPAALELHLPPVCG
jgi:hypothetical protein